MPAARTGDNGAMARSIWTGTISFGLVTVPVKMFSAVNRKTVRFHQLNKATGSRIQMRRVDPSTGEEVPYEDIVKGYEMSPDRYVLVEPDELDALDPKKTKTIDILDFVDPKEVDERYFETPYYLQAGKGADRAYALLREAIRNSGKIGVAKIILRDAQHLAAVEAIGDALVLTMMRFSDELADLGEFTFPKKADIRPAELKMAGQLIDNLVSKWDPDKYTDEYKENLMRVINAKMKGKKPRLVDEDHTPKQAEVVDLMARLRASLEGKKGGGSTKKPSASKGRKATRGGKRVA